MSGHVPTVPAPTPLLEPDLLAADPEGIVEVGRLVSELTSEAAKALRRRGGPLPPLTPVELAHVVDAQLPEGPLPREGGGRDAVLALARAYASYTVDLADPRAAAHLQPPALGVATATDVLASAFNASVDTWDSGPIAVELESRLVRALTALAGYGPRADGVLTPGGTASNLQALLIARDTALRAQRDIRGEGLAGLATRPVVYCSELAHFSVARACAVLGLGEDAVRPVPADAHRRMTAEALELALAERTEEELPIAVVATAGTTDYGSIDPLPELAAVAERHGVRLHVDAAYGGGALFSDRLRPLLAGIEAADSITIDLHKTAWQPAAASVLLVRDAADLTASTGLRVAYLNPDDDGAAGYDGLLGHSLATTRRADALKVVATFLALGQRGVGAMLEACHDLATFAAEAIAARPRLRLTATPVLTTVVFRYVPEHGTSGGTGEGPADAARADAINGALRRRLLLQGRALIGRTDDVAEDATGGRVRLKLTLLNPQATRDDIQELLTAVEVAGRAVETEELP
ncbi:aminotransferase class I/II-fold pyridoxal phosphate-dependent enzyme [Streptomyces triticirhizae]|uniref:Aminotransferase class I/II-fold pyridoxal phosphate-dependent enzyme n=2 Tax=Streptomyces triticirhizae TaxID=2483353 RepID=A0A3M2MBA2_9ACTN|nr:aminotransferase class I/II-fold pyridoxal phosphate-dependent enzyme [Streptomyces triticirhizae]